MIALPAMVAPRLMLCGALAFLWMVPTAGAQTAVVAGWSVVKALPPGSQVRIKAFSGSRSGALEAVTDDALSIISGKGRETFDRQQLVTVSIKKPGHRGRNTLIGLAIGATAGLISGLAGRSRAGQFDLISNGVLIAGTTALGGLVGTVIGVAIPTGGWKVVYRK